MSLIPALAAPTLPVLPWWMTAVATGQATNARISLAHLASVPRGAILASMANFLSDTAATADADPGAGNLRWNHATQASATELYISDDDSGAVDLSTIWPMIAAGAYLYLYQNDDLDVWQWWAIDTVTDAAGYAKLAITLVASNGAFGDDDPVVVTIQQAQDNTTGGYTVINEPTTARTMTPADAGKDNYIRFTNAAASVATFDSAEAYTTGMTWNIRAVGAGGLTLATSGVTLTPPKGGTLVLEQDDTVSVVMTGPTTGEVMGTTVAA